MGAMKDFDRRIRQGGDDAVAAVSEYVEDLEGEVASARACAEMMLQGTGQKLGEELARRVMDEHYPPRWIPVEERLPEEEMVLVWSNSNGLHLAYLDSFRQWRDADHNPGKKITHWMPLPEPPEVK